MKLISIDKIKIDGETQPRAFINEAIVAEYAERMEAGAKFPPVSVVFDGTNYWLWDGFHRWHARRKLGKKMIAAEIIKGTCREARWRSFAANKGHGLRRTPGDIERTVFAIFADEQWKKKPQTDIAKHVGISQSKVSKLWTSYSAEYDSPRGDEVQVTRKGKKYTQDTAKIGKGKRKKKVGGISPKAMRPVRKHSRPAPKTAVELPHDPIGITNLLCHLFDRTFLGKLVAELTHRLEGDSNGQGTEEKKSGVHEDHANEGP